MKTQTANILIFSDAFERLMDGAAIKRVAWLGYWCLSKNGSVEMHCADGSIRHGEDVLQTIENCTHNDWVVLTADERQSLDSIHALEIANPK